MRDIPNADVAISIELMYLADRCLSARRNGQHDFAQVYAVAAEGLLKATLPNIAVEIGLVASRKGAAETNADKIATVVTPSQAAAVVAIWMLRGSRRKAIDHVSAAFAAEPAFTDAIKMLFARIIPAARPIATETFVPVPRASVEVASPRSRSA